tara:strand:- start:3106 stop:3558 length:453 start_codon:yes stop_codon:yes gene_type:complete
MLKKGRAGIIIGIIIGILLIWVGVTYFISSGGIGDKDISKYCNNIKIEDIQISAQGEIMYEGDNYHIVYEPLTDALPKNVFFFYQKHEIRNVLINNQKVSADDADGSGGTIRLLLKQDLSSGDKVVLRYYLKSKEEGVHGTWCESEPYTV